MKRGDCTSRLWRPGTERRGRFLYSPHRRKGRKKNAPLGFRLQASAGSGVILSEAQRAKTHSVICSLAHPPLCPFTLPPLSGRLKRFRQLQGRQSTVSAALLNSSRPPPTPGSRDATLTSQKTITTAAPAHFHFAEKKRKKSRFFGGTRSIYRSVQRGGNTG